MNKITLDITLEEKIWLSNPQEKEDSEEGEETTEHHKEAAEDQNSMTEEIIIEDLEVNLTQNHHQGIINKNIIYVILFY